MDVSLLWDAGHPQAARYPIGYLWAEAEIVRDRRNGEAATQAILFQAAALSVLEGKEGAKVFNELIERLTDG